MSVALGVVEVSSEHGNGVMHRAGSATIVDTMVAGQNSESRLAAAMIGAKRVAGMHPPAATQGGGSCECWLECQRGLVERSGIDSASGNNPERSQADNETGPRKSKGARLSAISADDWCEWLGWCNPQVGRKGVP